MTPRTKNRLTIALIAYGLLALIAVFGLDGLLRTAVLLLLVGLAVRTIKAAEDMDDDEMR